MARNTGSGYRKGAVTKRSQTRTGAGHAVKRNTTTGRFTNVKHDHKPFKGIRREK